CPPDREPDDRFAQLHCRRGGKAQPLRPGKGIESVAANACAEPGDDGLWQGAAQLLALYERLGDQKGRLGAEVHERIRGHGPTADVFAWIDPPPPAPWTV